MKKIVLGAAAVFGSAVAAVAGGLADAITETEPMAMAEVVEQGGSIPGWVIPVGILAVLALAAASAGEEDGGEDYER